MSPVELFILDQPENLRPVLKKLRGLILSASPYLEEKLVYGIPFYYGRKRIFYLNKGEDWVDLGFCYGHLLAENQVLQSKNRSQVKTVRFSFVFEINDDVILPLIHEALIIDEMHNKREK